MLRRIFVFETEPMTVASSHTMIRTSPLDNGHFNPNCCLVCTANRLSLTSNTRLAPYFFCFCFCRKNVHHYLVFVSSLLGTETQKCAVARSTGTVA